MSLLEKARASTKTILDSLSNTTSPSSNSNDSNRRTTRTTTTTTRHNNNNNANANDEETCDDSAVSNSYTTDTDTSHEASSRNPPIIKRQTSRQLSIRRQFSRQNSSMSAVNNNNRGATSEEYQLQDDDANTAASTLEEAHHKQNYAPFSSLLCLLQCIILPVMMWQCGIAPLNINPMIGPYPDALNYWGAKNAVLIIEDGEVFRLLTPIFLHAGILHLAGNVLVQADSGNRWEKEWGSLIWLLVYIGGALGSSILSVCAMPDQISVGSSGAVMALFGAKLAEILLLCCEKSKTMVEYAGERSRKEQACAVIGGIVIVMAMSFIPYVDWAAHLGGLVAGFLIGLVCFSFKIRMWVFMLVWLIVGVGSTIALFSGALAYMYNEVETKDELRDVCGYYKQFFEDYECTCMLDEAIQFGSWGNNGGDGGGNGD